jgi:hypothetical protein
MKTFIPNLADAGYFGKTGSIKFDFRGNPAKDLNYDFIRYRGKVLDSLPSFFWWKEMSRNRK